MGPPFYAGNVRKLTNSTHWNKGPERLGANVPKQYGPKKSVERSIS